MNTLLNEMLDLFDLAVARADGVLPEDVRSEAAGVARDLRSRQGFLGEVFVMAIAGGTGSGKSSILNAIAGEEVASVSRIRPHTDEATAWVAVGSDVQIAPLLDDLGIERRVPNAALPSIVLIDLPDMDSVAEWHRSLVEELLPRVDAMMWVFDPIKYHDPELHEGFLAPLSAYASQFVFVLNQVDRLDRHDRELVDAHLRGILEADGFAGATVMLTAARPEVGDPAGIDELRDHLSSKTDAKAMAITKMVLDVRRMGAVLAGPAHLWTGSDTGFGGVGDDPAALIAGLKGTVGEVVADRLEAALAAADDEDVDRGIRAALWDRSYLGATIVSLGVATAESAPTGKR